MNKKSLAIAALVLIASAAILFFVSTRDSGNAVRTRFAQHRGSSFVVDGKPFRFVGANVAVMYRDEDRERMPETLKQAADAGIKVARVWAFGEGGGPNDIQPMADLADWPRNHPFRFSPDQWNEEAFIHLDRVLAEAAKNKIYVQLCLTNWWRDTGGVTQYLRWAGIRDAADDRLPFGINKQRAVLFYTNPETRRLYRQHVERLLTRTNSITGVPYREDPTIFGWELMNEAQVITGGWAERRAWFAEMSDYVKSLDPNHLVTPGAWGYRTAAERREWLADHRLPSIDFCDVHNYPRDDHDSFVDSPTALKEFIASRSAAALSLAKPVVFGEFGMGVEGYNGYSQAEWFRALFEGTARAGAAGAMFWILTPDSRRGYGVTYATERDHELLSEIAGSAKMLDQLQSAIPPENLREASRHLIPRQFAWSRTGNDPDSMPQIKYPENKSLLYEFKPSMATAQRFEKIGHGPGYIWGYGSGFIEYIVPGRADRRRVSEIVVKAHIQPVLPVDAPQGFVKTRVTLFVEDWNCGSRLIEIEPKGQPLVQEWRMTGLLLRLRAMRGLPLRVRFEVTPESDWLYGVNISNWPEGYDSKGARPVEVELRH